MARIDARGAVPQVHVDLRARDIELQQLKGKSPEAVPPLTGQLQARAVIEGSGDSVHKVLADARGGLTVVLPHGQVRAAFAELAGIDVAEGVGLLLKGNEQDRGALRRCAVCNPGRHAARAACRLRHQERAHHGRGDASLGSEELDLSVKGDPKKPRLVRLRTPIEIRGHFRKPDIGINAGSALKQGAIAAAVAAVATPLAAIFAFVDPGLAKDQNCATLLAQAGDRAANRRCRQFHSVEAARGGASAGSLPGRGGGGARSHRTTDAALLERCTARALRPELDPRPGRFIPPASWTTARIKSWLPEFESILDTVGRTPVVRIKKLAPAHVRLYVEDRSVQPDGLGQGSARARGHRRRRDAAASCAPGQTVIEATSGNTGIGLAMVCAREGLPAGRR